MEIEGSAAPSATQPTRDEPVTYLHPPRGLSQLLCGCAQGDSRGLALSKTKEGAPRLRPLDILPVSAIAVEIFILELFQLPVYREALQQFLVEAPPPLTEAADFRRRATAYRSSYFRSYRQATLLVGFFPELRETLLWDTQKGIQLG